MNILAFARGVLVAETVTRALIAQADFGALNRRLGQLLGVSKYVESLQSWRSTWP